MVHTFKGTGGGCKQCGYIRGNEEQHGHTCTGKMLDVPGTTNLARCYECGRTLTRSDIPIQVGFRR